MSLRVEDYSIPELITIIGLAPDRFFTYDAQTIANTVNTIIRYYMEQEQFEIVQFYRDILNTLSQVYREDVVEPEPSVEEKPSQPSTNTHIVPVKQDVLNPNLKNTIQRFVNLDSQFRQPSQESQYTTDYTLDLSETLKNTLDLTLYSYQIPFAWYVVDEEYGNDTFWLVHRITQQQLSIQIPSGNYQINDFVQTLTSCLQTALSIDTSNLVSYNKFNGKLTFHLFNVWCTPWKTTLDNDTHLVFFDFTGNLTAGSRHMNNTLGWIMGFRIPFVALHPLGNTGVAIVDLMGPKYLILAIDDFNQNHVNNGLISITEYTNTVPRPKTPLPRGACLTQSPASPEEQYNNIVDLINAVPDGNALLLMEKMTQSLKPIPIMLPTAPRTLTKAEIYAWNQKTKDQYEYANFRTTPPSSPNVFAILPIKLAPNTPLGSVYVDFSGSLQDSKRTYFGPVNIERMHIQLLDDKGNSLNLHGCDWSITLIATSLYQY